MMTVVGWTIVVAMWATGAVAVPPAVAVEHQKETAPAAVDGPPPPVPPAVVSRDPEGRVTLRAVRVDEPLRVDGALDEAIYGRVPAVTDFLQQEPREGEPATEQTEAWVLFDRQYIYIAARCHDSQPEKLVANEMRRDSFNIFLNDNFAVLLDTFHDRRNGFLFHTNPVGGLFDAYVTDERETNRDWNTVWESKSRRFERGWTVEMAIPFKSLRYRPGGTQVWGINLRRIVRSKNELSYLTRIPASYGNRGITKVSSAATLVDIEVPSGAKNLEIKPYAISALTTDRRAERPRSNDVDGHAGFDLKYGLSRGLTVDFTYNTDFAQVEEDEQQVNLTRFSLFFPERREFFLEGQGIFAFGGLQNMPFGMGQPSDAPVLFFSRRIGIDRGRPVPIEVGSRLTGKVGPVSVGALTIRTDEDEAARALATTFSVIRIKRDILRRSTIGAIATHRSPSTGGVGSNQVLGLDASLSFFQDLTVNGYYARSQTPGMTRDTASYRAHLNYAGDRYGLQVEHLAVGDHFNPEIGFVRRDDFRRNYAQFRFSPRPRSMRGIRKVGWEPSLDYITDGVGRLESRQAQMTGRIEFANGDQWDIDYERNFEFVDEPFPIARGVAVPVGGYHFSNLRSTYRLGPQRKVSGWITVGRGSFFTGDRTDASYRGRVELNPKLSLEPGVSLSLVALPWGRFTTKLVSTRATFTLSPRMFVSALVQYNSSIDTVSTNLRFRWEYAPGSDFFVVYSEGRDTRDSRPGGMPGLDNRSLAIKLTRLFRF